MKQLILKKLMLIAVLLTCNVTLAHDFEVDGIYYTIQSDSKKTVTVIYRGNSYSEYSHEYQGTVIIPNTVNHNGFVTVFAQRQRGVYTAVVEFDTLADTVWTTAENHNLLVVGNRILVGCVVSGVVVLSVLCTAYMDTFPGFFTAKFDSAVSDIFFRNL